MRAPALVLALSLVACQQNLLPPGGTGGGGAGAGGGTGTAGGLEPVTCDAPKVASSPMQRLRRADYDLTVGDLFNTTQSFTTSFPPEERALGFDNQASTLSVSQLLIEKYMEASETVTSGIDPRVFTNCPFVSRAQDGVCFGEFLNRFGEKVLRRPLDTETHDAFFALWAGLRLSDDFDVATRVTLQALLQSPQFLYRLELARDGEQTGDVVALDGWELASRLSYALWNTLPDDALFTAASNGELATAEQVEAQARRMLLDPKAQRRVDDFFSQWLDLGALEVTFHPAAPFSRVKGWLDDESAALASDIFWNGKAPDLFTATHTFGNAATALIYGGNAPGAQLRRIELDPAQRPGLFTRAAWLSVQAKQVESSPFKRGKFIRERVLCQQMPDPPPGIPQLPEPVPGQTTREHFAAHSSAPQCSGCHRLMDPLGFGFENFDAVGKWRDMQEGKGVDASGEVIAVPGIDNGTFSGPVAMMQLLANAEPVQRCVARQLFRFQLGRVEEAADHCSEDQAWTKFQASGFDLEALMVSITTTDAFRYRKSP